MDILSLQELKALPPSQDFDAGVYFLWKNDELQYIGQSSQIAERMVLQEWANFYGSRRAHKMKQIPFDRHTCIVLENGMIRSEGIRKRLLALEKTYIQTYRPPFNKHHTGR